MEIIIFSTIISGILSVLIVISLIKESVNKSLFNTNSYRQRKISKQLKPQILQLLRPDWFITEIATDTITKKYSGYYSVYVEVENIKTRDWTNNRVYTDHIGNIENEQLSKKMKEYDSYAN